MLVRFAFLTAVFFWLASVQICAAQSQPEEDVDRIAIGNLEVLSIIDATGEGGPGLIPKLDEYPEFKDLYAHGPLPSVFKCFYVDSKGHKILVDSGWGKGQTLEGKTAAILKREGIEPESITDVLLTHLDWDHIGGLLDGDKAVYPNATLWISRPEYEAWIEKDLPGRPEHAKVLAKKVANIYKDRIRQFDFENEILPGIKAIDASGHTPGHTAYEITSGNDKLYIGGDLLHLAPVQLQLPQLSSVYDVDPDKAAQSREKLLQRIASEKAMFAGMHIPMASMVRERSDHGFAMREPR